MRDLKNMDLAYLKKNSMIYIRNNKDIFNFKNVTLFACAWWVMLLLFGASPIYIAVSAIVLLLFVINAATKGELIGKKISEDTKQAIEIQKKYKESNIELESKVREEARLIKIEETRIRKEKEAIRLKEIQDRAKAKKEAAIKAAEEEHKKFVNFRDTLISIYFDKSCNYIKIDNFKDYIEVINLNQDKIIEIDHKYVRDFLRVSNILEMHHGKIQKYFAKINCSEYYQDLALIKIDLDKDMAIYENILALALTMLSALISKNLVAFYGIYEQFDSSGIFDSHHQMKIQKTLSDINENISNLGNKIEKITSAVYEMGYLNGNKLDSLNDVISAELIRVNSSISYPRLIENLAPLAPAAGLIGGYQLGYSLTGPSKK